MAELVKCLPLNHKDLSSYPQDPCKPEHQGRLHKVSSWKVQAVGFQKGLGSTSCSPSHKTRWDHGGGRQTLAAGLLMHSHGTYACMHTHGYPHT